MCEEESDVYRRVGSLTMDFDRVEENQSPQALALNRLRGREYMIQVCLELTAQLQNPIQVRRWRGGRVSHLVVVELELIHFGGRVPA
jgi:hypothetical protein